ncbi:MAG: asparagine synthase (glutamine-hydrolysing) [Bacteroidetes bacterium]|nr:MAG: asparagine synthase (glutamine-hydrolysing) [Bacteroidota bacterium]
MCGICGGIAITDKGRAMLDRLPAAVQSLENRGPDGRGIFREGDTGLGHTRLAVIDTSEAAAQPFTSSDGRYTIVFNGEIFNYRELRSELENAGEIFRTQSDTEVLLRLYVLQGKKALKKLNGFFAFAIRDNTVRSLFIARDRYGEKPLYYSRNEDGIFFASEIKGLLSFGIEKELNNAVLFAYLQLNYVPSGPTTMLRNVNKLLPGWWMEIRPNHAMETGPWHLLHEKQEPFTGNYEAACGNLFRLAEDAVRLRLVSDVPLGVFLSGGIDSSVIAALAAKQVQKLHTFSIGFPGTPHFDETPHARLVAKHIGSEHTVFPISEKDILDNLFETLDYTDEPFADSSALAVNLLSKKTRGHVTVALSGDGADELFAGYNKHRAEYLARNGGFRNTLIKNGQALWNLLPASRNSKSGNRIRQLRRFAEGLRLSPEERYWRWAGYATEHDAQMLAGDLSKAESGEYQKHRNEILALLKRGDGLNDVLLADMTLVLPGDMLVKVDRMSMCHGLEVRPPFLDHRIVNFVMQLPAEYKIDAREQKKILKSTFRNLLPAEIFARRKQGFEVPLHRWLTGELRGLADELLDEKRIREQAIFKPEAVKQLRAQLKSASPGDSAARTWGLIVFQYWWKKYFAG